MLQTVTKAQQSKERIEAPGIIPLNPHRQAPNLPYSMNKLVLTEGQEGGSKKMIASNDNMTAVRSFSATATQQTRQSQHAMAADLGSISLSHVGRCLIVKRSGMVQAPTSAVFKTSA